MLKNKERIIIAILIAVILIGGTLWHVQLRMERAKTKAYLQENFSKGIANVQVLVKIKEQTPEGQYNDSLYYPIEQWSQLKSEEIQKDIRSRVDKWINTVRTPAQE